METLNFEEITPDRLHAWAISAQPDELRERVVKLNENQLSYLIDIVGDKKEKLLAIIQGFEDPCQLEFVGNRLTLQQMLKVLSLNKEIGSKLSPLFVGLPLDVFTQMLLEAHPSLLDVLKKEAMSEPIQHQLTSITHELDREFQQCDQVMYAKTQTIQELDPKELNQAAIRKEFEEIDHLKGCYAAIEKKAGKALVIAWNTNRLDLIEKLGHMRELSQHAFYTAIGNPDSPEGLYQMLREKLDSVYEGLSDEEPATEALSAFSVWYLQHYWELGLLPQILIEENLDLPKGHSERERGAYREKLFKRVEENLNNLGLRTARDLKMAQIYSIPSLIDFLKSNQNKIT